MKEVKRMRNIAKIVFDDNLIKFTLENDLNSKYYLTNIIVKEKNIEQLRKFITDCDELISKPVTFKISTRDEINDIGFDKVLINNN